MLVNNAFANPEHFAIHVDLVFKNAQKFKPSESPIHRAACHLAKVFSERYNQLFEPGKVLNITCMTLQWQRMSWSKRKITWKRLKITEGLLATWTSSVTSALKKRLTAIYPVRWQELPWRTGKSSSRSREASRAQALGQDLATLLRYSIMMSRTGCHILQPIIRRPS